MQNEDYHRAKGVSASSFKLIQESHKHFSHKNIFSYSAPYFDLGSVFHSKVLEPEKVRAEYICECELPNISEDTIAYREAEPLIEAMFFGSPEALYIEESFVGDDLSKNSKAYKEAKKEFHDQAKEEGKTVVSKDTWEIAESAISRSVLIGEKKVITSTMWKQSDDMARNALTIGGYLFQNGHAEQSLFVWDEEFNLWRKTRPDYYRTDWRLVIDLKSTRDSSDREFSKTIFDNNIYIQAAWNIDTLRMCGIDVDRFALVAVESGNGHMTRVRYLSDEDVELGRQMYRAYLSDYVADMGNDAVDVGREISMPRFAREKIENFLYNRSIR